nr:type II toxin-antitoxin system HicB family antitoxin [Streptomyces sp. NBC_00830]WTB35755.1 type II toxin-antitoxin system HicB family antitoxin [Streptomyces sp. NBC_00830]
MKLLPFVELIHRELTAAAETEGDEARALAERLLAPLDSTVHLTLLRALSAAAAEISAGLEPGSVRVSLNGIDPEFLVTRPPAETTPAPTDTTTPPDHSAPPADPEPAPADPGPEQGTSRINLRLPSDVRARVEEAAAREHLSVNAWLVQAARSGLSAQPGTSHRTKGDSFHGWAR